MPFRTRILLEPGAPFGLWTVMAACPRFKGQRGQARYICKCKCGTIRELPSQALREGTSKTCGCQRAEQTRNLHRRHGMTKTPEWYAWQHMRRRCYDPKDRSYTDYGGRGITVSERWLRFENFFADMGKRPSPSHSIERKDNNGNYEKSNCKWATRSEQNNNKRSNVVISHAGLTMNVTQWAAHLNCPVSRIFNRINRGSTPEQAIAKSYTK